MKTTFLKAPIVIAIAMMALSANAQEHKDKRGHRPSPEKILQQLDANEDGVISEAEAKESKKGQLHQHFDKIDMDSSGALSLEELEAFLEQFGKRIVEHLDTDDDELISKSEAKESPRGKLYEHFDAIDTDSSGTLTAEELEAFIKNRRQK